MVLENHAPNSLTVLDLLALFLRYYCRYFLGSSVL